MFLSFIITDPPPPPSIFLSLPLSPPFHSLLVIFPDCTCGSILIIKCRADTLQMSPGLWPVIPSLPSSVIFLVRATGKLSAVTLSRSVCLSTHSLICSVGDWNRFLQMWRTCIVTEPHLQPLQNVLHYHTICSIFCPQPLPTTWESKLKSKTIELWRCRNATKEWMVRGFSGPGAVVLVLVFDFSKQIQLPKQCTL